MKELAKMPSVNNYQVLFGKKLGLDLKGCSLGVSLAKIDDLLDQEFWSKKELGKPSQKQINLAAEFGFDISNETKRVGSAIIDDIMEQLNLESIESQNLKPGDKVRNKWDPIGQIWVISSIKNDGLVFFKGGNGKKAWSRNLIKFNT